ncbi:hypothetical protein L873DRAFT_842754 [Choiromyces venosus 120613-1]|uniref:Uncharacterized protein n=1 Tax=Choiromyces venosus 120613-1 TaxID=1336337 RepID=A0A3N4JNW4_9PEZI|nr:hypothetical protein L873DRAFT_842754 [Choiromyces venosus 120613-1]
MIPCRHMPLIPYSSRYRTTTAKRGTTVLRPHKNKKIPFLFPFFLFPFFHFSFLFLVAGRGAKEDRAHNFTHPTLPLQSGIIDSRSMTANDSFSRRQMPLDRCLRNRYYENMLWWYDMFCLPLIFNSPHVCEW